MKQGTIFTNAALAAVLATSMATAPALAGLAHTQGTASASVAYAAQATPIESVAITGDWTATDAENQAILDKAEAAKLVGLKPLKAYLSGETVAAADFLTIDADALATIDADLAKLVKQTQKAIADSNAATEPEAKPETKPEPVTPTQPAETPAAPAGSNTQSASTGKGATAEKPAEDVEDAPEDMVQESATLDEDELVYVSRNLTTEQFISQIGEQARELCQENDLYASVMIAQAVVESASGSSGLSCEPYNNLFGIKGAYEGKSVRMKTQEDDGQGNLETIVAEFRRYPSLTESLEDYVGLLTGDSLYTPVKKSNTESYEDACDYLQGHYATSTTYSRTLKAYIDTYDLTQFDAPSDQAKTEAATLESVLKPTASQASFKTGSDDFGITVPEAGLPERQKNPVVAGLLAALVAAGAGALGFWLYWRRKVEGENAAHAAADAHASGNDPVTCEGAAAWSVDQAIKDWRPAHTADRAKTTGKHESPAFQQPAHASDESEAANLPESTTEPIKPVE
ncbi:glucosaminidase domain-containing protein [uncultured Senegalimassilia sp.]|uniref:glucosaminidase domain-containing protein n=1 Tax=uncultured Senegalimassilia sp. TaxID=1714350 RepID=UPI00262FE28F|nr:glucosaminidase domain-containing protein [uncultured Senegalimassilia sp.]